MEDVQDYADREHSSSITFPELVFVARNRTGNRTRVVISETELFEVERSEYFEYVLNTIVVPILFCLISLVGVLGNVCGLVV